MTEALWIAVLTILIPAAVAGIYRLWRDRQQAKADAEQAQRDAITAAEDRALKQARLEAVAREAQAALDAKNAELAALRSQNQRLETALIACAKGGRG